LISAGLIYTGGFCSTTLGFSYTFLSGILGSGFFLKKSSSESPSSSNKFFLAATAFLAGGGLAFSSFFFIKRSPSS
jgi:hypothetical protein